MNRNPTKSPDPGGGRSLEEHSPVPGRTPTEGSRGMTLVTPKTLKTDVVLEDVGTPRTLVWSLSPPTVVVVGGMDRSERDPT